MHLPADGTRITLLLVIPLPLGARRSDNGQRDTWITSSAMQWSMPYMLPAGIACDTGCVLQFKWFAMQTCVEPGCDRTYCGTYADGVNMVYGNRPGFCSSTSAQPEYFTNCAGGHVALANHTS